MIPVPVLDTLNIVVPASLETFWLAGLTESTGWSESSIRAIIRSSIRTDPFVPSVALESRNVN